MKKILMKVCEWLKATMLQVKGGRLEAKQQSCNENDNVTPSASLVPLKEGQCSKRDTQVKSKELDGRFLHSPSETGGVPMGGGGMKNLLDPNRLLPIANGQQPTAGAAESQELTADSSHGDSLMLRMAEFVDERYEVRYNRLSQQYELAGKGTEQWMMLDDEVCCRMLMEMNRAGIAVAKPYLVRTVVQGGGLAKMYHPVCSYLEHLPAWDGEDRIEALFRRITDDEQLLMWLRKWFIAMVAQVMGRMGTYGNSVCPILISARQGWGKSQFAKMLVPPQLRAFYTDTFNLAQEDACLHRMTAYMLVNVDEVDRFKDTRMATFKNLVQLAAVSMKRAYRSHMEERERMASFIATSNRRYLLHDESGSRRFICVELTRPIDVDTPIDYDQLYAEAMAALDGGERCWFDEEEIRLLEAHNADYSARRGAWDLLNRHFAVCDVPEGNEERLDTLWPATEVYDYLYDLSPTAMAGIERTGFAHYLKRMGAQQVRVKNRRLYGVAPVKLKIEN